MPSETESFGLVALEAMACEVPVVASNVGGLPEVIRDGQDGFLVKPHEVDTMALKAAALLADDRKHQAMGQSARQRALENFCSSKIIAQYEQYYEQVIRNGGFNNPDKH